MEKQDSSDKKTIKEQGSERSTSGGGLGQGREIAAGMPEDQLNDKGRPGKGMGGTRDGGSNVDRRTEERS